MGVRKNTPARPTSGTSKRKSTAKASGSKLEHNPGPVLVFPASALRPGRAKATR
ncbi:hypothetical protein KCP70_13840 [Salmonella enterica subsp. enterica]|nr:hypothetical protein KCP70_13840 [Salmonella enterica subsp. enterica]